MADKLGNRFEKLFVLSQYIELLDGKIDSIEAEKFDASGVDVSCSKDNKVNHYQCKSRGGSSSSWTVGSMLPLFNKAKEAISKSECASFVLVSAATEKTYSDIALSLKNNSSNQFQFYQTLAQNKQDAITRLTKHLFQSTNNQRDIEATLAILSKFQAHLFSDDQQKETDLKRALKYHFLSSPEIIFALLYEYTDTVLQSKITRDKLITYLNSKGVSMRVQSDASDFNELLSLKGKFKARYQAELVNNTIHSRQHTRHIVNHIKNNKNVIITGSAGSGKSGTILDVINQLEQFYTIIPINVTQYDKAETKKRAIR